MISLSGPRHPNIAAQHFLFSLVLGRDSLRFFECFYRVPRGIHIRLGRDEIEVCIADFGSDLLAFSTHIFPSDITSQFRQVNSETDLVLLRQRLIDAAG